MLKVSPMFAMLGWQPLALILAILDQDRYNLASWVVALHDKATKVRDYVSEKLAQYHHDHAR